MTVCCSDLITVKAFGPVAEAHHIICNICITVFFKTLSSGQDFHSWIWAWQISVSGLSSSFFASTYASILCCRCPHCHGSSLWMWEMPLWKEYMVVCLFSLLIRLTMQFIDQKEVQGVQLEYWTFLDLKISTLIGLYA